MASENNNGSNGASTDTAGASADAEVSNGSTATSNPNSEPQEKVHAATPSLPLPAQKSSRWPEGLLAVATAFWEWISRPAVRLTVTGVILLLIGGLVMTSSVWTLPLVIVGALMVVIAWIGHRLDGRFAIAWGETGTQLEFRARINAAEPARPALARTSSSSHRLAPGPEPASKDAEIVDGEAHTIEIDVAELKALIAVAETTEGKVAQTDAAVQATRNLRVARGGTHGHQAK